MILFLKVLAINIIVSGAIFLYREFRNAPLMDDEGNPIPMPKEDQGSAGP